jgi:hypothetical protein
MQRRRAPRDTIHLRQHVPRSLFIATFIPGNIRYYPRLGVLLLALC